MGTMKELSANGAVVGVILAGGLARRMGGIDKGLIELGGQTLLARLIERLSPQCAALLINANGDPQRFAQFGLEVVADTVEGYAGPLAGVLAGMERAADSPAVTHILTIPADTPFAPPNLAARLSSACDAGAKIAVAASAGRVHHTVALWPVALRGELRRALTAEDERRVSAFIARFENAAVEWPAEPYDPFFNVNRPEDVATAEKFIA
jgi:molybdenum cofactor guanylyltransferase